MIKNTRLTKKNTRLQKQTYTQWKCPENALQCQLSIDIVQLIVNQKQRKREIAATRVLVRTFTETFNRWPSDFAALKLKTYHIVLCKL